jgi:hypothetical protein
MADRFTASIRPYLLAGVLRFVRAARNVEGVVRIVLIGSLTTDKLNPKDADLLITISNVWTKCHRESTRYGAR